jgi:GPH family glycoside/pentoside/hexuronide:cation symporter
MPEPMPFARRLAYACGAPGFQVSDRIVVAILIYFYLPPEESGLEPQVTEEVFLGFLTAFGLAMLVGRIFDSLADPVVGYASDRSRSRLGRRRLFLLIGILPMTGIPVLGFWPPGPPGSLVNFVWLTGVLALYFVAFTVYVAPYLALLPELAWTEEERVRLSALAAAISFPIIGVFGFAWTAGLDWGTSVGLSRTESIRAVVVTSTLLGLLLCAVPIAAVDERRFARSVRSDLPLRAALTLTFRNLPFRRYLEAQLLFILGVNMLAPALPYVAEVVLGRTPGFSATLGVPLFVSTLLCFPLIGPIVRRTSSKQALVLCVVVFCLCLGSLGFLRPDEPGGPNDARNLAIAVAALAAMGLPIAGFIVLPNVILGQIIDYDERRTGSNRSAMYYGMQGFVTKWMYGVSSAVLAYLFAEYGKSREEPLGVLLIGPVAAVACLLSAVLYLRYPERDVVRDGPTRDA